MAAIYGDYRLLSGAESEFKLTEFYLLETPGRDQYAARFGFGAPVSEDREYSSFGYLRQSSYINLHEYWSSEIYVWESKHLENFFWGTIVQWSH